MVMLASRSKGILFSRGSRYLRLPFPREVKSQAREIMRIRPAMPLREAIEEAYDMELDLLNPRDPMYR